MTNKLIYLCLFLTSPGLACKCAEDYPDVNKYFENCEHIFVARLLNAKYVSPKEDPRYATFSHVEGELSEPTEIFKGNPNKIIGLKTGMLGTSCEGTILVGEEYLVCGAKEVMISVPQCSLTQPISWGSGRFLIDSLRKKSNK